MTDLTGTAIVLSATTEPGQPSAATTSLAAGAATGVTDIDNLRNPLPVPMLVDEILFNVIGSNAADIRLSLKLGSSELVKQFTPIALLGVAKNFSVASGANGPTALAAQLNSTIYGMKLQSELILYPSEFLSPIFYNAATLQPATPASVRMIVRGRAMKTNAQRQSLPWISYWAGALQTPGSNFTEETVESDIYNPFSVPLILDRMVGVVGNNATGGATPGIYSDPNCMDAGLNYATLRMVDGSGAPILRDYTPFSHLFQLMDYSWRLKGTMPANSFWKAYLTEDYADIGSTTPPNLQLMFSLIGHRSLSGPAQAAPPASGPIYPNQNGGGQKIYGTGDTQSQREPQDPES